MSENMLHLDELALRSAMGDLVLESSRDELIEALGEQEFAVLAQRGRSVVERAPSYSWIISSTTRGRSETAPRRAGRVAAIPQAPEGPLRSRCC